ncbi:MAG: proliferating cell nuclear antigen (pcna) [Candidatus Verstraetearchaeota archaeon]|jgi:proliferating cell nuclear antigen|uniref:DNA polymerase sliding clamp n=1 Tax=Thermoproteota archaeon TaxID=2056631 RepID=A0A523BBL6_9CREN|nr:proliferating cell nuclear antigen (pcna) [Candidatus Methanomethylicia archaeon]NHV61146.1 proliferating cell nuclear antigen (pcna) [Candidatus Verstraetearchaeota archaeon]TDA38252.1 MAG: proliferating cell nuclear antigen (pcna) [Candidatus Verstraetearchaeota archaeon]
MFKAVLADSKIWRNIIESISTLVEEGVFIADPTGIRLRAMDPSRVAMVDMELPKTSFDSYECTEEVPIGVNFDDMKNIMKRTGGNEKLELEKLEKEARLKIRFKGKTSRTFSLPLLDLGKEELSVPRISFLATVKLPASTLMDAIKDAEVVSDFVKITAEDERLRVTASGDRGEVEVEITKDSGELLSIELKESAHALYSLTYLSKMMVASDLSDIAILMFSTDMPLRLDFNLPNGGRIVYYLAPRMEAE